jgi:hypothetical protein
MSATALADARERFDLRTQVDAYLSLYQNILASAGSEA